MQFNDIIKAVHDAWTFSWPPIVMCIVLYCIAHYLNAEGTRQTIEIIITLAKSYGTRIENATSILEPYGLTKLIPVISAVLVIGLLYVVNGPVTIFASKLPPHI